MKSEVKSISVLIRLIVALFLIALWGCDSGGGGDGESACERVTALAGGYGDIEIHNNLDTGVEAFFPELAFAALIRPGKCEIYGVPDGSRDLELTQCNFASDDECNNFGNTQFLAIEVAEGEKDVIYSGDYF